MFGAQARRACAQYLAKVTSVLVDAEPDWREWTDQQNNKREAVTFKASTSSSKGSTRSKRRPRHRNRGHALSLTRRRRNADRCRCRTTGGRNARSATADDLPF